MQVRVTWRTAGLVVIAAALVVGLVCYLDWRRPVDERSHPGRFLQTVIDGGAWDVMSRRLVGNIETVLSVPILAVIVTVLLTMCVVVVAQPGALRTQPLARLFAEAPLLRRALWCIIIMAAIGFLTNDSGAAIPPVAALFTVPVVVSAVMHFLTVQARLAPVRRRRDRHHL
jgi:hypothetical protein